MFDTRDIPDFFHSITFDNGITVEFNHESTLNFYNSDEEMVMQLGPSDMMILYSAYRGMVRERCEEEAWTGTDDTGTKSRHMDEVCGYGAVL